MTIRSNLATPLLLAALASAPPAQDVADIPEGDVVAGPVGTRLDNYLSRLEALGFSGGAVVVHDGDVVLAKGYGLADRENGTPFTTDTVFPNGSITKPFTGALIVKLQSLGLLDFDDRLSDHVGPVPDDKRDVTLHHLLTHSSGLPGAIGFDFDPIERDEYIAQALQAELLFEPGTSYEYSNVGFALLAAIAEQLTDTSYTDLLTEHLLAPAGMTRTGYRLERFDDADLAVGYRGDEVFGRMRDRAWAEDGPYWHLRGNGGLHTTLRDSYRWHVALLGDELLDQDEKDVLFAPHVDEGGGTFYGYGWSTSTTPRGTRVVEHNGGNPYFSSDLVRWVDEDAMLFVHSNTGDMKGYRISRQIAAMLFGGAVPMPPQVATLDDATLAAIAGRYALPSGAAFDVDVEDGHLVLTARGQQAFALLATGRDDDGERRSRLAQLAAVIVERAARGDVALAHEAFGGTSSMDEVRAMVDGVLAGPLSDVGELREVRALGTVPPEGGGMPPGSLVSYVELVGSEGTSGLGVGWVRDRLAGFDEQAAARTIAAFPTGADRFTTWALGNPRNLGLRIARDDAGRPTGLVVEAVVDTVEATRVEE